MFIMSCRGAIAETRESEFGEGSWNDTDRILMDDVGCQGNERAIHGCNYVSPSNCLPYEQAGVVCQPNLGKTLQIPNFFGIC